MGRMLVEGRAGQRRLHLGGALDVAPKPAIGQDAGAASQARATGVAVTADLARGPGRRRGADRLHPPEGTLAHLAVPPARRRAVIGTTGFTTAPEGRRAIGAAAQPTSRIVLAPQHERGRQRRAAPAGPGRARPRSEGYDIEVIEAHHRHKVDAPAARRWRWARWWRRRSARPRTDGVPARAKAHTGERRPVGSIGFATVRGGDIVGEPHGMFAGTGERIEITTAATSANYAEGSLRRRAPLPGRRGRRPVTTWLRRARPEARCRRMDGRPGRHFWNSATPSAATRPRGAAAAGDVGRGLGADPLEGLAAAPRRDAPTSNAPCRATLGEARATAGYDARRRRLNRQLAMDREQPLLPLLDAATAAAGRLARWRQRRPGRRLTRSSRGGCATPCTAAWRTCSSARCCWPRSAARRRSSACPAPSGASTTLVAIAAAGNITIEKVPARSASRAGDHDAPPASRCNRSPPCWPTIAFGKASPSPPN